jgi:hypothetical protein
MQQSTNQGRIGLRHKQPTFGLITQNFRELQKLVHQEYIMNKIGIETQRAQENLYINSHKVINSTPTG